MALISYPNMPAIAYRGFGGYLEKDECEEKRIIAENDLANFEIQRGNTVYIKTYCMEMEVFEAQLERKKELDKKNKIGSNA